MIPGPTRQGSGGPEGAESQRRLRRIGVIYLIIAVVFVGLILVERSSTSTSTPTISYASFLSDVSANKVKSIDINQTSGAMTGTFTNGKAFETQGPPGGMPESDITLLDEHHVERDYLAPSSDVWGTILAWAIMIGLIMALWIWMGRRARGQLAGLTSWSKSSAKVQVTEHPSTRFTDVAGYEAVKQEVQEVVDFLKSPGRFEAIGARIPKGMLLVGPPGTGKTLLARATAGEAGVAFISITGSEFMEMFVGVGAARVRDLFKTAREHKPSIVFIDEIDAIGRKRGTGLGGGHDEREQTLNQILSEMDGFEATEGIVVLAATNRPDVLDPALLRPGRFDRQIVIPLPTLDERRAILEVHARNKHLAVDADLDTLARGSAGMSGADLESLLNEAALIAVRRGAIQIAEADLDAARDRLLLGLKRSALVLGPEEKRIVAIHESGHALLAELLTFAEPVHKVTILPIGLALGATEQLPTEERQIHQRPELEDQLAVRLAGRAAEELEFGVSSTGAADDLTGATALASRMVREWGMSDRLGKISWAPRGPVFLGEELIHTRDYSDATARVIDEEISRILGEQSARARDILDHHHASLEALADALVAKETLDGAEVLDIIVRTEQGEAKSMSPAAGRA